MTVARIVFNAFLSLILFTCLWIVFVGCLWVLKLVLCEFFDPNLSDRIVRWCKKHE